MRNLIRVGSVFVAMLLGTPAISAADESTAAIDARLARVIADAWRHGSPPAPPVVPGAAVVRQGRAALGPAGPNIGTVGLGGVGGLTDFEIGPSFRFWATDRIGVQAHLGFSGDDIGPEDVEYIRFEPTVIVAIGDFGEGSVNVRPYAGGGLRIVRTDVGPFDDSQIKPVGVGGVEFGFRATPRFNVSVELSIAPDIDDDDFDLGGRRPDIEGARVSALAHYFF